MPAAAALCSAPPTPRWSTTIVLRLIGTNNHKPRCTGTGRRRRGMLLEYDGTRVDPVYSKRS